MKKSKIRFTLLILAMTVFLAGLLMVLIPVVSGMILGFHQEQATQDFYNRLAELAPTEEVEEATEATEPTEEIVLPDYLPELYLAAYTYNQEIQERQIITSSESYEEAALIPSDYGLESDVFAILQIPSINLEMPIYLGASSEHLALGAAQIGQTSLPLGGQGSHCVIAGHRSWHGGTFFGQIPNLSTGAEVIIVNPWETLTYQVVDKQIVGPTDPTVVELQPDRDLVSLMTCFYGNNMKYRCVVICERTNQEEQQC